MKKITDKRSLVIIDRSLGPESITKYLKMVPHAPNQRKILIVCFMGRTEYKAIAQELNEKTWSVCFLQPEIPLALRGKKSPSPKEIVEVMRIWHVLRENILRDQFEVVVLSGINRAIARGLIPPEKVMALIDGRPPRTYLFLTQGEPHPWISNMADFIIGGPSTGGKVSLLKKLHKEV